MQKLQSNFDEMSISEKCSLLQKYKLNLEFEKKINNGNV